jgi:hypothetical protein
MWQVTHLVLDTVQALVLREAAALAAVASAARPRRGFRLCCDSMAGETFLIVGGRVMLKLLVRIMTSYTGETRVSVSPALAVFQTIRLKA